jgi:hypothetical protein
MVEVSSLSMLETAPAATGDLRLDGDYELVAQQVCALNDTVAGVVKRVAEVEKVNARLEVAALTTARALGEISRHWDAVYEAMRREEEDLREHGASVSGSSTGEEA